MSDFFWRKLNHIAGFFAIGAFFALAAFISNLEIKDLDLWLHLKTGKIIVESGAVPNHDVLSSTIAGKSWHNHEWLFQAIVYLIKSAWGFNALITMQSVVVCLTFLVLLYIGYRSDRQWLSVFVMLLVLMVYQSRFTIRPDIFSLLFFAINMYVLAIHLDKRISILVLALVQVLWANMHGFFFFGPLLVLIAIASETIKRKVPLPYEWNNMGRLTDEEFRRLWIILGVLLGMCLLNPVGLEGALYPLKVLFQSAGDSKIFFKHISELQPPFSFGRFEHIHYKILILISFFSFFFNRRMIDISVFLVWLVFLLFSLIAIRNMVFFACAAYLVILVNSMTINLDDIVPFRFSSPKFKDITGIMAKIALIIWMASYGQGMADNGYFDFDTFERKSEYGGVSKRSFPYKAVDFLNANKIKGNFFNDFNSGAYLVGRTVPRIKVFIDGRTEVYGGKFFEDYLEIWYKGNKKSFQAAAKRYSLTGAFLNGANQQIPPKAIRMFNGLKDWKLVYFDDDAMIYLKKSPQNQQLIDRFAIDLTKWKAPRFDLQKLGPKRVSPYQYIQRARSLMAIKLDGPALEELKIAQRIAPDTVEIYQLMGDIYGHQKKYRLAFEHFRVATMYAPNKYNRKGLAWSYLQLGNYAAALVQYERLLAENPGDAKIAEQVKKLKKRLGPPEKKS